MDFKADSQKVSFQNITEKIDRVNTASDTLASSVNHGFNTSNSVYGGNFSTIGINVNHIGLMKEALDRYIKAVYEQLDKINTLAADDLPKAFKGDYSKNIINYLEAFKLSCQLVVSSLYTFGDKLDEINAAFEAVSVQLGSNVNTGTNTLGTDFGAI